MKKQILLITLLLSFGALAQNGGMNYKALITNNNNALSNHNVTIKFTILQNGTTSVYQETQTATTDANGIVAVNIGEGTTVSGNFNTIDWGADDYFLKVEINTGSGYTNFGTSELKYVPYAKYADKAGNVFGGHINDLSDAKYSSNSLFLGHQSGMNDDGTNNENVGVGEFALKSNTSGSSNVGVGKGVLLHNTTGSSNVGVGKDALLQNTSGQDNIALGLYSLRANTTGHHNVAIGTGAGVNNQTGAFNVFIGANAGFNETGSNKLYIDNSNTNTPLIWGDFNTNKIAINGDLTVKNSTNGHFEIQGNNKHGWFSRFTNRLHIASDDAIYFGTNGVTDTDVIIKHNGDVQLNHKLTTPTTGTANLLPFAYGNVDHNFNNGNDVVTNGTGNFDARWDNIGVCQIRLYNSNGQEIPFNEDHFTVLITPRSSPHVLYTTFHVYSNRLYVEFKLDETHHLTSDFSILIYKN